MGYLPNCLKCKLHIFYNINQEKYQLRSNLFFNMTDHFFRTSALLGRPCRTCIGRRRRVYVFTAWVLAHGKNAQLGFLSLFCPLKAIKPHF